MHRENALGWLGSAGGVESFDSALAHPRASLRMTGKRGVRDAASYVSRDGPSRWSVAERWAPARSSRPERKAQIISVTETAKGP